MPYGGFQPGIVMRNAQSMTTAKPSPAECIVAHPDRFVNNYLLKAGRRVIRNTDTSGMRIGSTRDRKTGVTLAYCCLCRVFPRQSGLFGVSAVAFLYGSRAVKAIHVTFHRYQSFLKYFPTQPSALSGSPGAQLIGADIM